MKKIVIIGAGEIGRQALEFIGAEGVAYFADNKKAGITYCDKEVYSVEKAAEDKKQYVLLLANTKYREELIKQLNGLGVYDFYYFDDDIYFGNIFQGCGFSTTERVSFYDCIKNVSVDAACVYGDSRIKIISEGNKNKKRNPVRLFHRALVSFAERRVIWMRMSRSLRL